MTPLQELTQSSPAQFKIPWPAAALFLIVTLTALAVVAQRRPGLAVKTTDTPPAATSLASTRDALSLPPDAPPDPSLAPSTEPPATNFAVTQAGLASRTDDEHREPLARTAARVMPLTISVEPSQVGSEDHFAEIRLHRNRLQKDSSFTWWTEPATAKPDVDYVPEAVAIQTFPAGYRTTRLYVRLLPQSLRSQRSYFYIAIAQTRPHQAKATVVRRQVWLPTSSELQAKR